MTDHVDEGTQMRIPSSRIPRKGGWEGVLVDYAN